MAGHKQDGLEINQREREMEGSKQPANGEVVMSLMACLSGFWAGLGPRGISRKMANQKVSEVTCQSISSLPTARKIDGGRGGKAPRA